MVKTCLWTASKARLQWFRGSDGNKPHWLFLPGGPGLGSESLNPLLNILELPGSMWRLDLPGDGSNTTLHNKESFSCWQTALVEAVSQWKHVILVAHSTGGMYALSTPEIEKFIDGLILLDSAPDARWQSSFALAVKNHPIHELAALQEHYRKDPSNWILRKLTLASAPYLFTKKGIEAGRDMLSSLPFNYETCQWSEEHFDQTYEAKWVPRIIPTLILSGEHDLITPLKLFSDTKAFHRDNIQIRSIPNAGHYPWIDNPADVTAAFMEYCKNL
jgi:pimeloyl-ACP methyl ester carboxylesterase